jgi:hypothetical protein
MKENEDLSRVRVVLKGENEAWRGSWRTMGGVLRTIEIPGRTIGWGLENNGSKKRTIDRGGGVGKPKMRIWRGVGDISKESRDWGGCRG